ncbi:GreA/GreB family elongation factor [Algoriphagus limi]|uniref:GreA/GreB family elongation factor n=1 Tax=Algoriphagus limi TaxID=2975273 RepID=A0ABT2G5J3_9BACT|nr:GreA/GreB family elongation factor [Algoriphagus limi]MCS5490530.1 GreA/GreB family elongation factor [Algoriphagus limi]
MNLNKEEIFQMAVSFLKDRLSQLQEERKAISEGILEDDKSSAGDKFETGREMLTQDLRQVEGQIKSNSALLEELYRIQSIKGIGEKVREGSLVKIGDDHFLISVALGKLALPEGEIYLISPASPLAQQIFGKSNGDSVLFKGKSHQLELIA